jgi:hypothetical protein
MNHDPLLNKHRLYVKSIEILVAQSLFNLRVKLGVPISKTFQQDYRIDKLIFLYKEFRNALRTFCHSKIRQKRMSIF